MSTNCTNYCVRRRLLTLADVAEDTPLLRSPATKQNRDPWLPTPTASRHSRVLGRSLVSGAPGLLVGKFRGFSSCRGSSCPSPRNRGNTRATERSSCVHLITRPSIVYSPIRSVSASMYSVQNHIVHCKTSSAAKRTPAFGNPVCMALDLLPPHPFPPPSQRRGVQTNGPFTQSVCRPGLRLANPSSQIHRSCVCPLTGLGDPCLCDFQLLVSHQSLPLFVVRAWYAATQIRVALRLCWIPCGGSR